jgi:cysteine sulfinate desulfinase/cysteine desulfurase-like protein
MSITPQPQLFVQVIQEMTKVLITEEYESSSTHSLGRSAKKTFLDFQKLPKI